MFRLPIRTFAVLASSLYTTGNHISVATQLPDTDFNSIVYKLSISNGLGNSDWAVDFAIQTTDDGGTTWWDMTRYSIVTATASSTTGAVWATIAADDNTRMVGRLANTIASGSAGIPHLSNLIRANFNVIGVNASNSATLQLDSFLNTVEPH